MALRIFLVGIVASLALEIPADSCWTARSRSVSVDQSRQADLAMPNGRDAFAAQGTGPGVFEAVASVASVKSQEAVEVVKADVPAVAALPIVTVAAAEKIEIELMPMPAPAPDAVVIRESSIEVVDLPPAPAAEELKKAPTIEVVDLDVLEPSDPDAGFKAVVGSMAMAFAADVSPVPPVVEPVPVLVQDEVSEGVVVDLDPALATLPGYEAEKAAASEPEGCVEPEVLANPGVEPVRSGRLTQAVRLTGMALDAWGSLLRPDASGASLRR